jgi:hypothetical protein
MLDNQQCQYIILVKNGFEVQKLFYGGCNLQMPKFLSLQPFSH